MGKPWKESGVKPLRHSSDITEEANGSLEIFTDMVEIQTLTRLKVTVNPCQVPFSQKPLLPIFGTSSHGWPMVMTWSYWPIWQSMILPSTLKNLWLNSIFKGKLEGCIPRGGWAGSKKVRQDCWWMTYPMQGRRLPGFCLLSTPCEFIPRSENLAEGRNHYW